MAIRREWVLAVTVVALMLVAAEPAFAVNAGEVAYTGGTIVGIPVETIGTLNMGAAETLAFRTKAVASGEIDIAYAKIFNFQYSTEVAHHIGVLPAIGVSLVKKRERKHFFTISYADVSDAKQVAIFEVSKDESPALLAVLRARAAQACGRVPVNSCGVTPGH